MQTVTKPIIISFSGNNFVSGLYYYYRVVANGSLVYFGKTFCSTVEGVPTVELDLRRILQANAYNSQYSLKPVYDNNKQIYTPSFAERKRFADTDIMQRYTVYIDSDLEQTVVAQTELMVTSAYDLIQEMPAPNQITAFIQPLKYRTNLIPCYPNVVTDLYGIYFFTEYSGNLNTSQQGMTWMYLLDSPTWSAQYNYPLTTWPQGGVPGNVDTTTHLGYRNTLPFNITMEYFFTNVTNAFHGESTEDNMIIGGNSTNETDIIVGGNSTNTTNIIVGGSASSAGQQTITRDFTGDVYISSNGGTLVTPEKVAHIDECTKKYYLAWQTHSGAPFSYGFDGNTVKKSTVERTVITNYSNFDSVAAIEQRHEWELRSGIVSADLYDLFADILDSPYLYLYSVEEDKSWYCTLQDNDFTWKKVKVEKQPLNLTLNLKECSSINK